MPHIVMREEGRAEGEANGENAQSELDDVEEKTEPLQNQANGPGRVGGGRGRDGIKET